MKLMKHITIALVLCAIPAMAFGQVDTVCEVCTHQTSVYMGDGGLIATAAEDAEMVTYVASCGGVSRSGEEPVVDGKVTMLFSMDNGLACAGEGGSLMLGPIADGGWYWITDDMNSAVGNLVSMDILDNEPVMLTGAGDGVTMTMGKGAVFVKETASGRVGILPNILPEPAMDAVVCGPRMHPSWPNPYSRQASRGCALGDGGTKIRLRGPGPYGGQTDLTGGTVTRNNSAGGDIVLYADLWVNESGSYATGIDTDNNGIPDAAPSPATDGTAAPNAAAIQKGWIGKQATAQAPAANTNWLTDLTWHVTLHGATPGATATSAGVTIADANTGATTTATPDGQAEITIAPSASYCPARGAQTNATVNVLAFPGGVRLQDTDGDGSITASDTASADNVGGLNLISPPLATDRDFGFHAVAQITVVCPPRSSSSSHEGQELVPENPFPTDE